MNAVSTLSRFLVIAVMVLSVAGSEGCAATIKRPKAVELTNSNYPDFPYRIEIPATEITRYNVHQLKAETTEQKVSHYLFLKRRLGQLKDGEYVFSYYVGSLSTGSKSRGLITVTAGEIVIAIEVGVEKSATDRTIERYVPCELNGRYLINEISNARPEPTK